MTSDDHQHRGPIASMARNPVAANLFMIILIVGGLLMLSSRIRQEVFPEFEKKAVSISIAYPGASPAEVENGIILAVEEAIDGIDGIEEVRASALEGRASVTAELRYDADQDQAAHDIEQAVDRITTLPADARTPVIEVPSRRRAVLDYLVYGEAPEQTLSAIARTMRDDLLADEHVSQVDLLMARDPEISVALSQDSLRTYGLTVGSVADLISHSALELPAGELKTPAGKVLLRTAERRELATQYKDLTMVGTAAGADIRLGDMAEVTEGFEDTDKGAWFDGSPALRLLIYRTGDQTPAEVSQAVRAYDTALQDRLPPGIHTRILADRADYFTARVRLLVKNGAIGLVLVFVFLGLFLQPSLAFWVGLGIPISFMGSLLFLPGTGTSLNMISLFAYIITLGIVVDDAIVVGENIYERRRQGDSPGTASIRGAREIAVPVVFSVLTTIAAFAPLHFVHGTWGQIMGNIPTVVIIVLLISLFESLFILPAHLTQVRLLAPRGHLSRLQRGLADGMERFARRTYGPLAARAVRHRWITCATGVALILVSWGYVAGGHIRFRLMDRPVADFVTVAASLPADSPASRIEHVRTTLERAAGCAVEQNGETDIAKGLYTTVNAAGDITCRLYLVPTDERDTGVGAIARAWRRAAGPLPGLEHLAFLPGTHGRHFAPVSVELSHRDADTLELAGIDLAASLDEYAGLVDIDDGFARGKPQLDLRLSEAGGSLGITAADLGRQVHDALYGAEALELQRGDKTVRVMVRLNEDERVSEQTVQELMIRTPAGGEIPLREAAIITRGRAYTDIRRRDGRRILTVSADLEPGAPAPAAILQSLSAEELPDLQRRYPGLSCRFAGEKEESAESMDSLKSAFILALLIMYCLVAVPLKSYTQPLIVLLAIPFGFVGALIGHVLFGYNLSLISMYGLVALSGVVINDSLLLVHTTNGLVNRGLPLTEAVQLAGVRRFRPIILTSLTTFLGLMPMIFETSRQARFLIPMVLSLGFGVLFATLVTLFIVPSLTLMEEDIRHLVHEMTGDLTAFVRRRKSPPG